jgi:hypothetical protein
MIAAPPPRDSALDALGFAFGVLRKPGYLWAPMALTVVLLLPLLAVSAFGPPPPVMPSPGFAPSQPPFATQAEFEAYFASLVPALVASIGFVQLVRLLQNPIVPPPPPLLPDWMNPPAPDPGGPPVGSGPASSG